MQRRRPNSTARILHFLSMTAILSILSACSDKSNPTDNPGNPSQVSIPLEGALDNIQLSANQTTQMVVTLHLPPSVGKIKAGKLDVVATMSHLTATNVSKIDAVVDAVSVLSGEDAGTISVRVGGDESTVCQQGALYGPYTAAEIGASPFIESVEFDESSIQLLNSGPAIFCLEILPTFNATVGLDALICDIEQDDCGEPADFSGNWTGTYTCGNSCGESFGGGVELTVTQNGNEASYVDASGDHYVGTICGNVFRFERVDTGEIERGEMTLVDLTHATKRSTWREQGEFYCDGNCVDNLTRVTTR